MGLNAESYIEVRFTVYQYNSGAGDNGCRDIKEAFPMTPEGLAEATKFAKEIQDAMEKGRQEGHNQGGGAIASKYCWQGFISDYEGMVRVDRVWEEVEHVLG